MIKVDEKANRDASVHERVEPAAVEPLSISEETAVDFSIIGEAFHSYIIVEKGEDLYYNMGKMKKGAARHEFVSKENRAQMRLLRPRPHAERGPGGLSQAGHYVPQLTLPFISV